MVCVRARTRATSVRSAHICMHVIINTNASTRPYIYQACARALACAIEGYFIKLSIIINGPAGYACMHVSLGLQVHMQTI